MKGDDLIPVPRYGNDDPKQRLENAVLIAGAKAAAAAADAAGVAAMRTAEAWRRARALRLALVICLLSLALVGGVNWLARQPWGGSDSYTCTGGGTLHSHTQGDKIILTCS
jgi:hypothetical protein